MGMTIVDSIDTLIIMGMTEEYQQAKEWIASSLRFDGDRHVSMFEVTIRVLGGLLTAYHLTDERMYLEKAVCIFFFVSVTMHFLFKPRVGRVHHFFHLFVFVSFLLLVDSFIVFLLFSS